MSLGEKRKTLWCGQLFTHLNLPLPMVPVLSSAASTPLPGVDSFCAVAMSSAVCSPWKHDIVCMYVRCGALELRCTRCERASQGKRKAFFFLLFLFSTSAFSLFGLPIGSRAIDFWWCL
jgi:hypothetical protein